MDMTVKIARCIVVLSLVLVIGSASARSVMAQDPTPTVLSDLSTVVPTTVPAVEEKDDGFDDWGLLGLLGLLGLAGLRRKPKVDVQPVTRTVVEPPVDRTQR